MATEIEDRDVEQALLHQVEHADDAAGAAVAVVEGMNALELVVDERHLHQRIGGEERVVIDEAFEVGHQRARSRRTGRRIDDVAASGSERCRATSGSRPVLLELGLEARMWLLVSSPVEAPVESHAQGLTIPGHFFGRPAGGLVEHAACWNSSSWVVTMFSMAELSLASCRPSVLIRMAWFGIEDATPFNSASCRLAAFSRARIAGAANLSAGSTWSGNMRPTVAPICPINI